MFLLNKKASKTIVSVASLYEKLRLLLPFSSIFLAISNSNLKLKSEIVCNACYRKE